MVVTRSATKKIESGQAAYVLGECPPADCFSLTKKRRRQASARYMAAPKDHWQRREYQLTRNLDVFSLIAADISPGDLLNLARTCKSLRRLLMDKSSAFIWRAARRQFDGLPECPPDLSEPEYAYLAFHPFCHNCGEYSDKIFWGFRRRYCFRCRVKRLCTLSSFHEVIRNNRVLASEHIGLNRTKWYDYFDKEQLESFMLGYLHSSNKKEFVENRVALQTAISTHAKQGREWELKKRWDEVLMKMRERKDSIFERLKQLGFEREVSTPFEIEHFHAHFLNESTPLTDEEWNQQLPKLLETVNRLRSSRLEMHVYAPRRQLLASEYTTYLKRPLPNAAAFDVLPHATDVSGFLPFQEIINAPEESEIDCHAFESAFAQMPELIARWRKTLDAEITELVKIPPHFSSKGSSIGLAVTPSGDSALGAPQTARVQLRLACAMFQANVRGLFRYPEVLSTSMIPIRYPYDPSRRRFGSNQNRYGIEYITEAPYVVRACGLDPGVATPDDMDRRGARLKCLTCDDPHIRNWRDAIWHAFARHHQSGPDGDEMLRWQIVSDEDMATGVILGEELKPDVFRCLLCHPHVGDAKEGHDAITSHLDMVHKVDPADVRQGEHYTVVGMTPVES